MCTTSNAAERWRSPPDYSRHSNASAFRRIRCCTDNTGERRHRTAVEPRDKISCCAGLLPRPDRRAVIADDEEARGQKRGPSDPDIERRNGLRTRSLNDPRQGSLLQPRYCTRIRCKPSNRHHPPAKFRLLLNGLAASELRRMFLQLTPSNAGLTEERRLRQLNSGVGAKSTRGRKWIVLYSERCKTRSEAHESRVVHQA
jgi:hypothetical protein